jgi:plastocyanin
MSGRAWRVVSASVLVGALMGPIAARPAGAVTTRVTMADMKFTPARLEVQLGDTVVWLAGDDDHTVTARDGSFDSSPRGLMAQGDEFRWRFRVPGDYPYYCRVHGNRGMQGEIVVTDPSAPATATTLRPAPATAEATTSTTGGEVSTTTAAPTTTTTRVLATSSTTSPTAYIKATAPPGVPAVPQEPPTLNPAAPVVASESPGGGSLPETPTASRRSDSSRLPLAVGLGAAAVLVLGGGGLLVRRRGSRARSG